MTEIILLLIMANTIGLAISIHLNNKRYLKLAKAEKQVLRGKLNIRKNGKSANCYATFTLKE